MPDFDVQQVREAAAVAELIQLGSMLVVPDGLNVTPSDLRRVDAALAVIVPAVTAQIRALADLNGSIWLSRDTRVVRVTHKERNGVEVTESMIRVDELEELLDQIDAAVRGEGHADH